MTQKETLAEADKKDAAAKVHKAEPSKAHAKAETTTSHHKPVHAEKSEHAAKKKTPASKELPKEKKRTRRQEDKQSKRYVKGEWDIIEYPHLSEKININVEFQNKIIFIVKQSAKRSEIKKA